MSHLQLAQSAAAEARTVEGEQHGAVIEVLRARDEALHFRWRQDDRQPLPALRIR
jgi:hypothetical protein